MCSTGSDGRGDDLGPRRSEHDVMGKAVRPVPHPARWSECAVLSNNIRRWLA